MEVNVEGLVENGFLDLDEVFDQEVWKTIDTIGRYTVFAFGVDGDEPGHVNVVLQTAEKFGIVVYRWKDDSETGDAFLSREECLESAEDFIEDSNEIADLDDLVYEILGTEFFGKDATANDIKRICDWATEYSEGYLLLAKGTVSPIPCWTTNGHLECDYVALNANYPEAPHAAFYLLKAIENFYDEENS